MKKLTILFAIGLFFSACSEEVESPKEGGIDVIPVEGSIEDIIRNPVSAENTDTTNMAKIVFDETVFDFGEVDEGAIIEHTFKFTNTGKAPLLITGARSTCGCTIPEWPKEPIPPGEVGELNVVFKTEGKKERQRKPVTVSANTFPGLTEVFVQGYVHPKG